MNRRTLIKVWLIILALQICVSWAMAETGNYLIIYHSSLAGDALNDLFAFESGRGFNVIPCAIGDGVSRDSIKSIVMNHYHNDAEYPRFVLLVGAARRSTDSAEAFSDASGQNLIPAFCHYDRSDHTTGFDYDYSVMYADPGGNGLPNFRPGIILGRIPAVDTIDLRNYVEKAILYYGDTLSAAWKDNLLALYGDRDRGTSPDVPSVGDMIGCMNTALQYLPETIELRRVNFTDFGADLDSASQVTRLEAIAAKLDTGQALVLTMATGANPANFSYMLYRGNSRPGFDAGVDLDSTDRYSVIIGASCELGRADSLYENGTIRFWPENFLFAPHRGAVVYIGASGFSQQSDNMDFSRLFLQTLIQYPDMPLGQIFTHAQSGTRYTYNLSSTFRMYHFYGDPSLPIRISGLPGGYNARWGFSRYWYPPFHQYVVFDYDFGKPLPKQYTVWQDNAQITNDTTRMLGFAYYVSGTDNYQAGGSAYQSWHLYDSVNIPITDSTRFLSYYIASLSHPEDTGRYGINATLAGGGLLSDQIGTQYITDQYGTRVSARYRHCLPGDYCWYAFDLSALAGDTIKDIFIEYDAVNSSSQGTFEFELAPIVFSSKWGVNPSVGEIDMISSMTVNSAAAAKVLAFDYDESSGDTLRFVWTATAGYFTGTGDSVTYHAPSTARTVTVTLHVYDLGGYDMLRTKQVSIISSSPPGGCPFVYIYQDGKYQLENVLLTESEKPGSKGAVVTDYYPLLLSPDKSSGEIKLRIGEEEQDKSFIYDVSLIVYDLSDLEKEEQLAISNSGELVAIRGQVKPRCADVLLYEPDPADEEGGPYRSFLNEVSEKDGIYFESNIPGRLWVNFGLSGLLGANSGASTMAASGGGVITPPAKEPGGGGTSKPSITLSGNEGGYNYLKIDQVKYMDSAHIADVYPRIRPTIPYFVDFSDYIDPRWDDFTITLSWTDHYKADEIALYSFRRLKVIDTLSLSSALFKGRYNVLTSLMSSDSVYVNIFPGEYIDLAFKPENNSDQELGYVLKVSGRYEKYVPKEGPSGNGPVPDIFVAQNFPNPFNSETVIKLSTSRSAQVEVAIYNILGQKIRTIYSGNLEAGENQFVWNGKDDSGNSAASGVYLYKVICDDYIQARKMVLLK